MDGEGTTVIVQRYLDELAGDAPPEPVIRALLERAVFRLHQLCATLLHKNYPRLTRSPLSLETDEMLSAVVERLIKALREARPKTVREFFALAGQHTRWELNDLARRLDVLPMSSDYAIDVASGPLTSGSPVTENALRMIRVIDDLPNDEREAFDLVRIQGMSQTEAAEVLGVTPRTIRRRLDRGLLMLTEQLSDLDPRECHVQRPQ
jgi:RNA polymerase sigma-70 factor (ECF subfamily)